MPALFVSYSGLFGGAERVLVDVALALDEPPALACPDGELAERARDAGLHVLALSRRSLEFRGRAARATLDLVLFRRDIRRLAVALRPEVVVAWGMRPALASAGLGAALVFSHHDLLPGGVVARAVRAAARRADVVVATSDCVAREVGGRPQVIHPGVDAARFAAPPPQGSEVLLLGTIARWKRPELALDAVALAARERPDIRLRIAGTPIDSEGERMLGELRARAERPDLAGRVEFAGRVDSTAALARATCLLHCADREPFGLVLVEAMAAGRPVVAPSACGPLEIVDDTCGRVFPPGDARAAARALLDALANADTLGAAGRKRAERLFPVEATRARYRELLGGLGRGSAARPQPTARGLALLTVTHNSEGDLRTLLASVRRHLPGARVVVVDSGSEDRSAEVARNAGAEVIELGENVGFGRASNVGVSLIEEAVTVLVNPDVELLDGSLAVLAAELEQGGPDRLLAPLVVRPDGSRQDAAQAEPGSFAALAIAFVPPVMMPPPLRRAACPWTSNSPRRVGWAVGCCIAARTETLRRLGPFDEHAFLYAEDLDLGLRAADAQIETWFRPEARVLHHGAHSSARAFGGEPFELLARRRHEVIAERRGRARARLDDCLQALTFADRIVLKALARRDRARERAQLKALVRARR